MEKTLSFELNEQTIKELETLGIHVEKREDFFLVVPTFPNKNDKFELENDLKQLNNCFYDQMNDGFRIMFSEQKHLCFTLEHYATSLKARSERAKLARPEITVNEFMQSVKSDFKMWRNANNLENVVPDRAIVINIIPEKGKYPHLKGLMEYNSTSHVEFVKEVYKRAQMRGVKLYEMSATTYTRWLMIPSIKKKLFEKIENTKKDDRKPISTEIRNISREYEEIESEALKFSGPKFL
jgi:hypothetical protein